jgi:hypothetical protein
VAVSINLARIIASTHLPAWAGETLVVLVSVLCVASFGLVPGQGVRALGAEILAVGSLTWCTVVATQVKASRDAEARRWLRMRAIATQAATVPFLVAGVLLVAGRMAGVYWVVPGTLASFGAGALNAWVLLVEIQR